MMMVYLTLSLLAYGLIATDDFFSALVGKKESGAGWLYI